MPMHLLRRLLIAREVAKPAGFFFRISIILLALQLQASYIPKHVLIAVSTSI